MTNTKTLFNTFNMCRICLVQSQNLYSLKENLKMTENSPTTLQFLQQIMGDKVGVINFRNCSYIFYYIFGGEKNPSKYIFL